MMNSSGSTNSPFLNILEYLKNMLHNDTVTENELLNYFYGPFNDLASPKTPQRDQIVLYTAPIVYVVGVFGHLMSFLILPYFAKKEYSYVYLLFLSIFDLLVLNVGLLIRWLHEILGVNILSFNDYTCKMLTFLGLLFSDTSVWLLVAVTMERFIILYHPFRATLICTVRRSLMIIFFLVIIIALVNIHVFWTLEIVVDNVTRQKNCDSTVDSNALIYQAWPLIDSLIYSILPFLSTCVLNYKIIQKIRHIKSRNRNVYSRRFSRGTSDQKIPKVEKKLTITMVILSVTFMVTTLPMLIYLCVTALLNSLAKQPIFSHQRYRYFRSFAELMMYCNHAINFYLYIANSRRLRLWFRKRVFRQKAEKLVTGNQVLEKQEYSSRFS